MNSDNKEILMTVLKQRYGSRAEIEFELMNKYYIEILDECMIFLRKYLEEKIQPDLHRIKIIKNVSEYRGLDNLVYGPFK